MVQSKESPTEALVRLFQELGVKVVTIKLTKEQQRAWDKRDAELKKFLKAKEKSEKESKKCKMVFKSGTQTDQTPKRTKKPIVAPCANLGKKGGNPILLTKNGQSVKLPKTWGKIR